MDYAINDQVALRRDWYDLKEGARAVVKRVGEDYIDVVWIGMDAYGIDSLSVSEARDVLEVVQ